MNTEVLRTGLCEATIKASFDPERLDRELDEIYSKLSATAKVQGFRKRRAPRSILEMYYGDTVNAQILEKLVSEVYEKVVVKDASVVPIDVGILKSEPKIRKGEPLELEIVIPVEPEVDLGDYNSIKIRRPKIERVTRKDIDERVETLRRRMATSESVEDRILEGDYVTLDYELSVEGVELEEKERRGEGIVVYVEEKNLPPGLAKGLVGLKPGYRKDIPVEFPEDYSSDPSSQAGKLSGKKGIYSVLVREVKRPKLPEVNDELAKDYGYDNLKVWREALKEEIADERRREADRQIESQILDRLVEISSFEVPETMIQRELDRMISRLGMEEAPESQKARLKERFRDGAIRNVRINLILKEIARREKIEVSDAEVDSEIARLARDSNREPALLKSHLVKRGGIEPLKADMLATRVMELLKKRLAGAEKSVQEESEKSDE
ncbi:MAG: trigger factor [bacterium]